MGYIVMKYLRTPLKILRGLLVLGFIALIFLDSRNDVPLSTSIGSYIFYTILIAGIWWLINVFNKRVKWYEEKMAEIDNR